MVSLLSPMIREYMFTITESPVAAAPAVEEMSVSPRRLLTELIERLAESIDCRGSRSYSELNRSVKSGVSDAVKLRPSLAMSKGEEAQLVIHLTDELLGTVTSLNALNDSLNLAGSKIKERLVLALANAKKQLSYNLTQKENNVLTSCLQSLLLEKLQSFEFLREPPASLDSIVREALVAGIKAAIHLERSLLEGMEEEKLANLLTGPLVEELSGCCRTLMQSFQETASVVEPVVAPIITHRRTWKSRLERLVDRLAREVLENPDPDISFYLGVCHDLGHGAPQSADQAVAYYQNPVDAGSSDAMNNLGVCYLQRFSQKDRARGVELLQKAVDLGNTDAMVNLGHAYDWARGVELNTKLATALYKRAAERGNPRAMNQLALHYLQHRQRETYPEAQSLLKKAAVAASAVALHNLSIGYANRYFPWHPNVDKGSLFENGQPEALEKAKSRAWALTNKPELVSEVPIRVTRMSERSHLVPNSSL